jgi:tetratricopeptide (TPR) repeat protein
MPRISAIQRTATTKGLLRCPVPAVASNTNSLYTPRVKPWVICACTITLFVAQPANKPLTTSAIANEWLDAAELHEPGVEDAPLRKVRSWNVDHLERTLRGIREAQPNKRLNALLERGALLHADITLLNPARAVPTRVEGWPLPSMAQLAKDGQNIGVSGLDAHVFFGRTFLRAMRPPAPHEVGDVRVSRHRAREWAVMRKKDPRIRQWFRALSAHFAARHWLADQLPHLDEARRVLDDTASTMFDIACLSESIASPRIQRALPPGPNPSKMNTKRLRAGSEVVVLEEGFNLAEAERFYRDAIKLDPGYAEAHVRLARVLSLRNRHADALALLHPTLDTEDPVVLYYGALAEGQAAEATQKSEFAREAYERAAGLFPRAQSPLLALMRLARERADDAEAKAIAARFALLAPIESQRVDPWWDYFDCNGRHRDREVERLWAMFRTR